MFMENNNYILTSIDKAIFAPQFNTLAHPACSAFSSSQSPSHSIYSLFN